MSGPKRKSGVIRSTDTSGDVTPSSTIGALTSRHVCIRWLPYLDLDVVISNLTIVSLIRNSIMRVCLLTSQHARCLLITAPVASTITRSQCYLFRFISYVVIRANASQPFLHKAAADDLFRCRCYHSAAALNESGTTSRHCFLMACKICTGTCTVHSPEL